MNALPAKLALNVMIISLALSLAVILGSGLFLVNSVQAMGSRPQPEPIIVSYQAGAPVTGANAGLLLQASGDKVFYLTAEGQKRLISDGQTFHAFGFEQENIIRVADDFLAAIPPAEPLTRLVLSEQGNLYWVMDGQRWLVNEWRAGLARSGAAGLPVTTLDEWQQNHLPTRLNLEDGTLLRAGKVTYYLNSGDIIPVKAELPASGRVIDVPAGALAAYQQKGLLKPVYLRLAEAGVAIEVRQGPGFEYGALGPVANQVQVEGKTANGKWVRTMVGNQVGWLPASALANPMAANLLPAVTVWEVMAPGTAPSEAPALASGRIP